MTDALLPQWGLAEITDDAKVVVSELVTNAYVHAPGPDTFHLELLRRSDGVRISLADGSAVKPLIAELTSDRPSGRGLAIVEALASDWGAEERDGGKIVWVELDLPRDAD